MYDYHIAVAIKPLARVVHVCVYVCVCVCASDIFYITVNFFYAIYRVGLKERACHMKRD